MPSEKERSKKHYNLIRFNVYSLEEVLPHATRKGKKNPESYRVYGDKRVRMNSLRYQLFAAKGIKCVICGLEGQYFALEQDPIVALESPDAWHFNLYGIDAVGDEVLFTKDHIHPRAKGGSDRLDNLQTMCYVCNQIKGAK